jgi:hypothetical protein
MLLELGIFSISKQPPQQQQQQKRENQLKRRMRSGSWGLIESTFCARRKGRL